MAIFLDSAILAEAEYAKSLGWVQGFTTNPVLLARAGGKPTDILLALARLELRPLFYQLVATTLEGMVQEMQRAAEIVGPGLVLKVPPTPLGFQFISHSRIHPCCVTAVFSPAQALVARAAGARYVAVYVSRATRLLGSGLTLVNDIAQVLANSGTEIVAASLKSTEEASASSAAGAHHLTLALEVLVALMEHPLSDQALEDFTNNGVGI